MSKITALLFLVASLSSSGCSLFGYRKGVVVEIPARPELADCPVKPPLVGQVSPDGKYVALDIQTALALKKYMAELETCSSSNVVILNGHIEKLENRLKALK